MKTNPNSIVEGLKNFIRQPYVWPGGYPLFAVTNDGECLCKSCVKKEYKTILSATKDNDNSGWRIVGVDVNWECEMYCAHCGEQIESAYEIAVETGL